MCTIFPLYLFYFYFFLITGRGYTGPENLISLSGTRSPDDRVFFFLKVHLMINIHALLYRRYFLWLHFL